MFALGPRKTDKFTMLYHAYGKYIYHTIKKFGFDEYTIEDLSQEIYMIIAKHLDDIDLNDQRKTRNYIITITRNYCINYRNGLNRRAEESVEEIGSFFVESEDILDQLIQKEQIQKLFDEINKMDDIYKSVMELKYVAGFCNQEIADFFKVHKKTVEMRLYRAKKILWERLKS